MIALVSGVVINTSVSWAFVLSAHILQARGPVISNRSQWFEPGPLPRWHVLPYEGTGVTLLITTRDDGTDAVVTQWQGATYVPIVPDVPPWSRAARMPPPDRLESARSLEDRDTRLIEIATGWPCLALRGSAGTVTHADGTTESIVRVGIPIGDRNSHVWFGRAHLPIDPIWPG
ncbi:MAG: hypothetical protein KDA05_11800, partial [Phycisphaerales bacterium]|nr:hypothetical protein [Phycisphaerales bacterium]